jgi:hypothetical protein
MNDRVWLERVWVASRVYQQKISVDQQSIDHFVKWLYREYGIVLPKEPANV